MKPVDDIEIDVVIVGAGVIGLAVAAALPPGVSAVVVERHDRFGSETSSRNSEVVHSGIYYPKDSLKTALCIEGRQRLYSYCAKRGIGVAKTGKLVVSHAAEQTAGLEKIAAHCRQLEVPCLRVGPDEVAALEPLVRAAGGALHLPESGIVDSHALMASLEREAVEKGVAMSYRHRLTGADSHGDGWRLHLESQQGGVQVRAAHVVNAAGIPAASLSNSALGVQTYEHRLCRGRYMALSSRFRGKFRRLIYPLPEKDGLGVHVTLDLEGGARLGPDVDWKTDCPIGEAERLYDCDWDVLRKPFAEAAGRYLPGLTVDDLSPGLVGIRTKLFVDGQARPDFLVEEHRGWVHCLGIESPGLTASLAIADRVVRKLAVNP